MQADSTLTDGVPAQAGKPPQSYYVISALALVWYAIGVTAFVTQITSSPAQLGANGQGRVNVRWGDRVLHAAHP